MKSKDEVTAKLQRFIIDVGRPGTLVSDGALEFKSKQFSDSCTSNGIKQEVSAPYTPEENGKIERAWGTVTGMTRCMMATAGVPKQFWPFALSTAIYLKNRSIHSAHGKTSFESFTEASLTFHIFTCLGARRLRSTKSGRNWTARHGKVFYWDTREILRPMW